MMNSTQFDVPPGGFDIRVVANALGVSIPDVLYNPAQKTLSAPVSQATLDNLASTYDPLAVAKMKAAERVKTASRMTRAKYVTDAPGKDAEYEQKRLEAAAYAATATVGPWMQGRMTATGEAAASVAAEWSVQAAAWVQLGAAIAGLEDKASADIDAATTIAECEAIADQAVVALEGM